MEPPPQTQKQRKLAGQAMSMLLDRQATHVRLDSRDPSCVEWIGTALELHGELGTCTCCHGGDTRRALKAIGR